jgi:hypothetical protein
MSITVNNAVAAYDYFQSWFVPTIPPSVNVYVCGASIEYNVPNVVNNCAENRTPIRITWPGGNTELSFGYVTNTFPTQPPFLVSVQQRGDDVVDIIGYGPWAGSNRSTANPQINWIPYVITNLFNSGNVQVVITNQSTPPTPTYYDAFGTAVFAVGPQYSYPYAASEDTSMALEFPDKDVPVFTLEVSTFTFSVLTDSFGFPTVYLVQDNNTLKLYDNPPNMGTAWVPLLITNTSSTAIIITLDQSVQLVPTAYNPLALSSFVVDPNSNAQVILYPDSIISGQFKGESDLAFTQRGNSLAYVKTLSKMCVLRYVPPSILRNDPQAYMFFDKLVTATITNTGVKGDSSVVVTINNPSPDLIVDPGQTSTAITITADTLLTLAFSAATNTNPYIFTPGTALPGLVNIIDRNGQPSATLNVTTAPQTGNYIILVYTYPAAPYQPLYVLCNTANPDAVSVSVVQTQTPRPTPFDTNATTQFTIAAGDLAQPLVVYTDTTLQMTSGSQTMSFTPSANKFGTYYLSANNTLAYYIAVTYTQGISPLPDTVTIQTIMPFILASQRASNLNVMLTARQSEPNVKNSWNDTPNAPLQFNAAVGRLHYTAFPDTVFDILITDKNSGAEFVPPFPFAVQTTDTHTLIADQVLLVYTVADGITTLSVNTNPEPSMYIQQTFINYGTKADLVLEQSVLPWACPWDPVGSLVFSVPQGSTYNVVAYLDTTGTVSFPSAVPTLRPTNFDVVPAAPANSSVTWYTNTSISYESSAVLLGSLTMGGIIASQTTSSSSLTTFTLQPQGTWMATSMQNQTPEFTISVQASQKTPVVPTLYDPNGDSIFTLSPGRNPYTYAAYSETTWLLTCDSPATVPLIVEAGIEETYNVTNLLGKVIAKVVMQKDVTSNTLTNPNPFNLTVHANLQRCTFVSTVGALHFVDSKWQPAPWPQVTLELLGTGVEPISVTANTPYNFDGGDSLQIKVTITWLNPGSLLTSTEFITVSVPSAATSLYYPDLTLHTGPELVNFVITPTSAGSTLTCKGLGAWDANRSTTTQTLLNASIPIPITIDNASSAAALFNVTQNETIVPSVWDPNGLSQFYVQAQNTYTFLGYDSTVFSMQVRNCAGPVLFSASAPYTKQPLDKACLFLTYQADTTVQLPRASTLSIAAPPYAVQIIMDFQPYVLPVPGQYSSRRNANDPIFGFNMYSDLKTSYGTLTEDRKPIVIDSFVQSLDTVCTCEVWVDNSAGTAKMYLSPFQFTGKSESCIVLLQDQGNYTWFRLEFINTVTTNGELSIRVTFAKSNNELADVFAASSSGQTSAYGNVASPIVPGVLATFGTANAFALYNDAPHSNLNIWGFGMYMPDSSVITTYGGTADIVKTLPADDPSQLFTFVAVDGGKWWALKNAKYGYLNVQNTAVSQYTGQSATLTPQPGKITAGGSTYDNHGVPVTAAAPQWMVAQREGGGPGVLLVRQGANGTAYAVETGSLRFTNGTVDTSSVCKGFMKLWQGGVRARRTWLPCGPVIAEPLLLVGPSALTCVDAYTKFTLTYLPPFTADTAFYKTALTLNVVSGGACSLGQVPWVWSGSGVQTCTYPTTVCPVIATVAGQVGCARQSSKKQSNGVPPYGIAILLLLSVAIVAISVCIGVFMHKRGKKIRTVS